MFKSVARRICTASVFSIVIGLPTAAAAATPPDDDARCTALATAAVKAPDTAEARLIAAGTFQGPTAPFSGRDLSVVYRTLPAFCRVSAIARPSKDSEINIEVWLPASGWNGRLLGLGNGGFAGLIDFENLAMALSKGYAVTATDAGHKGSPIDATWAPGHPEKVVDFGHRAIHEMTRLAKLAIVAYYDKPASKSYFDGCSDGGREALMEAQRYPEDYDGILAGAPANSWTKLLATAVWHTRALTLDQASFIPPQKIPAIAKAVNAACDGLDGVTDGILADPRQCRFDPAAIACTSGDAETCLTSPQVTALRAVYAGPRDASGRQVYPGYPPGAETGDGGWALWITGPQPKNSLMAFFGLNYFSQMVHERPDWDYRTFEFDAELAAAVAKTAQALDATDPDLTAFSKRGGKLVMYHGWQDPAIPALSTVEYFDEVVRTMGSDVTHSFARLYMAPGVQHCGGGPGPDAFGGAGDWTSDDPARSLRAGLVQWVENRKAPGPVIATKYDGTEPNRRAVATRPLCAHPQQAKYKGSGDTKDAANFSCQ